MTHMFGTGSLVDTILAFYPIVLVAPLLWPIHKEHLLRIEGAVRRFRAMTRNSVQIEVDGLPDVIELSLAEAWVVRPGDAIVLVGQRLEGGKIAAYAYRNSTAGITGRADVPLVHGYIFIVASLFFAWGIFPLFFHLPQGFKMVLQGRRVMACAAKV